MIETNTLKQRALELGFDLVGVAPASAIHDLEFLPQWLRKGYGGEMRYLSDPRREDPHRVLPSVKSIVCVGLVYNTPHPHSTEVAELRKEPGPRAWISRYAWGHDYHEVMRRKLEELRSAMEASGCGVETRVYVDTGPVVERAFARLSGIGWMGKNTCLINESKGSWFFLGVILTNLELAAEVAALDRCGTCTRCLEACPTGALVEPYVMDASRCISYLTIELKGPIPVQLREVMGNNVFGCDICQDVCPWNKRPESEVRGPESGDATRDREHSTMVRQRYAATTGLPEFQPQEVTVGTHGGAPSRKKASSFLLFNPALQSLASITEEDFRRLFAHSPIKRAKYRGWLRNLCVAMGNSGDQRFIPWLEGALQHPEGLVREHAAWALERLRGQ